MADRILFDSDNLSAIRAELARLYDDMSDVSDALNAVNTSGEWWSKIRGRNGRALNELSSIKSAVNVQKNRADTLGAGVARTQTVFEDAESRIVRLSDGLWTSETSNYGGNSGSAPGAPYSAGGGASSGAEPSKQDEFQNFLWKLVGGSGLFGEMIADIRDLAVADNIPDGLKALVKIGGTGYSWCEFINEGNPISEIFGVGKYLENLKDIDCSWSNFGKNFRQGFGKKIADNAGWVVGGITSAIDNFVEWDEGGRQNAGRYVREAAAEAVFDVTKDAVIMAATGAVLSAAIGTAAPVALAGVAAAFVSYGADWVCKQVTSSVFGSEMSLTETVGHLVGEAYDRQVSTISALWSTAFAA